MGRFNRRCAIATIVFIAILAPTILWYIGWTFGTRGAVTLEGMGIGLTWDNPAAARTGFDSEHGFHWGARENRVHRPSLVFLVGFSAAAKTAEVPLWPIPFALAVIILVNNLPTRRGRRSVCEACGYCPDGLVEQCPECGARFRSLETLLMPFRVPNPATSPRPSTATPFTLHPARTPADLAAFRTLCLEYAKTLEYTGECKSLEHQCFDTEMQTLPGAYANPLGEILLAIDTATNTPIGCVALRPLSDDICEMKRMYTRPTHRGRGVGRLLATALIAAARERGYRAMRLDTGATMHAATALYRSLGFRDIPAYNRDPVPGTIWMELAL